MVKYIHKRLNIQNLEVDIELNMGRGRGRGGNSKVVQIKRPPPLLQFIQYKSPITLFIT